jgi:hypothetical protein
MGSEVALRPVEKSAAGAALLGFDHAPVRAARLAHTADGLPHAVNLAERPTGRQLIVQRP